MQFNINIEYVINHINGLIRKVDEFTTNPAYKALRKEGTIPNNEYIDTVAAELFNYLNHIHAAKAALFSDQSNKTFLDAWRNFASVCFLLNKIIKILNVSRMEVRKTLRASIKSTYDDYLVSEIGDDESLEFDMTISDILK